MSIPIIAGPVGYDSWYVKLYREICQLLGSPLKFKLDWLASEKKLVIHTDRVDDNTLTEIAAIAATLVPVEVDMVQYNHNMEISWRDINKYAECKNKDDMLAVNADYYKDVTSDLEWIYPLPSLTTMYKAWCIGVFSDFNINSWIAKKITANIPICTNGTYSFFNNAAVEEIEIYAPELTTIYYGIRQCDNLKKIKGYFPKLSDATRGLGSWCYKLTSFDAELPSLSKGGLAFESCKLDKPSVLKILNSIPSYTSGNHPLTLGIHIDLQNDEEIWTAIHDAEVRGWTMEVSWNPGGPVYTTPTT